MGNIYHKKNPKKSLFLHHTASSTANSSWSWWNNNKERVGTAYLIDRDGTVIECFDPKAWAYHLGIKGDNNFHEKHGIGIEMVSLGRLKKEGIYYRDTYNQLHPEHEVCTLGKPYKNQLYFHKFTDQQISALVELMSEIKREFPLIPFPLNFNSIFEFDSNIITLSKPGVYSHGSVRRDKDDIFPQPNLIEALNSAFNPGLTLPNEKKDKPLPFNGEPKTKAKRSRRKKKVKHV